MPDQLVEFYIDNQKDFEQACDNLASSDALALDTEFERRNTYYPILALLQIADKTQSLLIDPFKIEDWTPLKRLFASDALFVLHSCSEDLEVFRKHLGTQPVNLMDTQIACAFLGKGDSLGYAKMVMALRGVEVGKTETRSDWMQRPLTQSQKDYAREDVRWLLSIYEELKAELEERSRFTWVQEECAQLRDKYWREPDVSSQWLRIKGIGRIQQQSWPLAYALAGWREECSRRLNKPRGWIMKDSELLKISQYEPQNKQGLMHLKAVRPYTWQRNSTEILELVNSESLPVPAVTPLPPLDNNERVLLKSCQKIVSEKAQQLDLYARFIANKQELSELIHLSAGRTDRHPAVKSGWRFDLVGQELNDIVALL